MSIDIKYVKKSKNNKKKQTITTKSALIEKLGILQRSRGNKNSLEAKGKT